MDKRELKDKIAGAVYGFMVGDAMGATTEFMDRESIKQRYPGGLRDIVGGGFFGWEAGECTDDTQMTACVMDVIVGCPYLGNMGAGYFEHMVAEKFFEWYGSKPKDIGNACANGICSYINEGHVTEDESVLGNGALMRAMPCAIVGRDDLNLAQAHVTHFNDTQDKIILAYSEVLRAYLAGAGPSDVPERLRKPLEGPDLLAKNDLREPTGHVHNTYINALHWSSKGTFKECVTGAVNDGGDADTIAAIAGSLAGARFGLSSIPGRWVGRLKPEWKAKAGRFINYAVDLKLSLGDPD